MRVSLASTALAAALLLPAVAQAQTRVSVEPLECIPAKEHAVVTARVSGEPGGSTVRLYFRRLHQEVEDLYYVEMNASGGGDYWAVLPSPAVEDLEVKTLDDPDTEEQRRNDHAAWWLAKEMSENRDPNDDLNTDIIKERAQEGKTEQRDWMRDMPLPDLETWLEDQELEPAEYYATVVDADGREIARSTLRAVPVKDRDDCEIQLDRRELGQAMNLVVGETAPWQAGRPVFHWLCDGIVSRIDSEDILRIDERCRACAFALNRLLVPATAGTVGVLGVLIDNEPEPASPTSPLVAAGP